MPIGIEIKTHHNRVNEMINKLINIWNVIGVDRQNAIFVIGFLLIFLLAVGWYSSYQFNKRK